MRGFKLPCVLCSCKYINVRFKSGRNSLTFIRQIVSENKFRCCLLKQSKSCPGKDTCTYPIRDLIFTKFVTYILTYILLNLVGLLKEMNDKQCDLHTFNLKCNIVKKIFSQFFARICIFSSKCHPKTLTIDMKYKSFLTKIYQFKLHK